MTINFFSFKGDPNEICTMDAKSEYIETMMGSRTDEIIEELVKSLLQRY